MRIVLDTNVLVSGFLSPDGAPAAVLGLALGGELVLLFDARILAEYREVLARPRFKLDAADVEEVLGQLESGGEHVEASALDLRLPDADDLPFAEVALSGRADALVTGNASHFPARISVRVLSPRGLLQLLDGGS